MVECALFFLGLRRNAVFLSVRAQKCICVHVGGHDRDALEIENARRGLCFSGWRVLVEESRDKRNQAITQRQLFSHAAMWKSNDADTRARIGIGENLAEAACRAGNAKPLPPFQIRQIAE